MNAPEHTSNFGKRHLWTAPDSGLSIPIGIQAVEMNYQLSRGAGTKITYGLLNEETQPGGPVDKAGLKGGS